MLSQLPILPHDLLLILAAWVVVSAILIGVGLLVRSLLGAPAQRASDLWLAFWLGWTGVLLFLQLWQFLFPIDDLTRIVVVALGSVGLARGGIRPWTGVASRLLRHPLFAVAFAAASLWLANHALYGPRFGDSGLYFIPKISWVEQFRIVPGLANLFVPLGHNQTSTLYTALLDGGPLVGRSYHFTNSGLVWMLTGRVLLGCERLLRRQRTAADFFYAAMLPAMVSTALSVFYTSPSPDVVIGLFGIVLAGELIEHFCGSRREDPKFVVRALTWIAAAGLTVKLSITGLSLALPPLAFVWWLWQRRPTLAAAVRLLCELGAITAFAVVPWVASNLVSSGCPFYPSFWGMLPVDWHANVNAMAWIQGPMQPISPGLFVNDPHWVKTRLESLGWAETELLCLYAAAVVGLVLAVALRLVRWWRGRHEPVSPLILLPTVSSLLFCFATTPMPRYQGSTVWVLAVELLLLGIGTTVIRARWWLRAGTVVGVVAVTAVYFSGSEARWAHLREFENPPRTGVKEERLASGLVVNVPIGSQTCWNSALPCTPEPQAGLKLRRQGDLRAGFTVDPAVPNAVTTSGSVGG